MVPLNSGLQQDSKSWSPKQKHSPSRLGIKLGLNSIFKSSLSICTATNTVKICIMSNDTDTNMDLLTMVKA